MSRKPSFIWKTDFFPASGERHSPIDYIDSISVENEKAQIYRRIQTLTTLNRWEWPQGWVKDFGDGLLQLTAGNHRLYFATHERILAFIYACRKRSRKTKRSDIAQAESNLNNYFNI